MTLFSAGMMLMVLGENMVQFILGWEIMGLCSFMLIGHWWEETYNSESALKAFWTVRVGDVGLLVGVAILFFGANAWAVDNLDSNGFSIQAIQGWALSGEGRARCCSGGGRAVHRGDRQVRSVPAAHVAARRDGRADTGVVAAAQLDDGRRRRVPRRPPVPGVLGRVRPRHGGGHVDRGHRRITIVIAALLAFVQDDIKKVLAYSTVSQLGYMMLGLGVGAWLPAVFHIFTHAFFKCCLFLCAGSISHSGSHHSFDMKKDMGGLRKHMPITFWAWIVCHRGADRGHPVRRLLVEGRDHRQRRPQRVHVLLLGSLVGAALTAMYMTRATYLTFFGEPRGAAAGEHHDDAAHHEDHEMET